MLQKAWDSSWLDKRSLALFCRLYPSPKARSRFRAVFQLPQELVTGVGSMSMSNKPARGGESSAMGCGRPSDGNLQLFTSLV